jgi:hypothetical protein
LQPYAELFGLRCNIPTSHILNFSEEVVRDQALFVGSLLAAELEPRLRQAAGASSWQVRGVVDKFEWSADTMAQEEWRAMLLSRGGQGPGIVCGQPAGS